MALPSDRIQQPNLVQMFMLAQQLKSQQTSERWRESQLARAIADQQREDGVRQRLGANDIDGARALDPTAVAKYEETLIDLGKKRSDITKAEGESLDARQKRTLDLQQRLLSAAKSGADIGKLRQARDAAVGSKQYDRFDLPGDGDAFADVLPDSPEQTQKQIATLERQAGVEDPYAKPTGDMVEFEFAKAHPEFDARQIALRRAGATTINNNLKDLPASQVNELADYQTAIESVDSLLENFRKNVASGDVTDQLGSRVEAQVPNSSVSQYNDAARATMQAVGLILEGGKLAAGDEIKYAKLLPKPGDSDEVAAAKAANIKNLLGAKARNRGNALGQGGFRTPKFTGPDGTQSDGPSEAQQIAKRAAELKRAGVPQARALEIMRQEGYQIGGPQ